MKEREDRRDQPVDDSDRDGEHDRVGETPGLRHLPKETRRITDYGKCGLLDRFEIHADTPYDAAGLSLQSGFASEALSTQAIDTLDAAPRPRAMIRSVVSLPSSRGSATNSKSP